MKINLNPYFAVKNVKEALAYYTKAGFKTVYKELYDEKEHGKLPGMKKGDYLHAFLSFNGAMQLGLSASPKQSFGTVCLSADISEVKVVKKLYNFLAKDAKVMHHFKDFKTDEHGCLDDKFGLSWLIFFYDENEE